MKEKKRTFTYATTPKKKNKAAKKAAGEGLTLSEKIDEWISEYVKPVRKIKGSLPLPADYKAVKTVFVDPFGGEHQMK